MHEYIWVLIRTVAIFLILMLVIRLLGKREVGQLSIFDLVVLLIIADVGAMGIDNGKQFIPAILCLFLFLLLQKIFSKLLLHNPSLRGIIDGKPIILIKDGNIIYDNLKKENYTIDDLINQIHMEGIMDVDEIRLAFLETSGKLSVFSKKRYNKIILPVIVSGRIDLDMIQELNITSLDIEKWLGDKGVKLKNVLYASSDGTGFISFKTTF